MSTPILLNGLRVIEARVSIPWRGIWLADVILDLDDATLTPAQGPAILTLGSLVFKGTIDALAAGSFATKASVRVKGGGGGWDKTVPARDYAVAATDVVYLMTGGEVGETTLDPTPIALDGHFSRTQGPASRVFGDRQWFVHPVTGVTTVSDWTPAALDPDAQILDYDPIQNLVSLSTEEPVLPGMTLVDERFNGKALTVRDVEQTWRGESVVADCWCSSNTSARLQQALRSAVAEFAQTQYLKTYLYRVVFPLPGGQMAVQCEDSSAPDLNPVDQWVGLAGTQSTVSPGSELVIGFIGGDPRKPYVVAYSHLAQVTQIAAANQSVASPVAMGPWAQALTSVLALFAATAAGSVTDPVLSVAATTLLARLGSLPPPITTVFRAL